MNERIEALKKLSTKEVWGANDQHADCPEFDGYELDAEKFAELIVRECVSILRKPEYPMTHPEELTDYNRGWVNGRLLGIEHIAYRFGVKE